MAHARDAGPTPSRPGFSAIAPVVVRGSAGYVRIGRDGAGVWWWIDPEGERFFSCGVNAIGRGPAQSLPDESAAAAREVTGARLDAWSINTVGPWSAPGMRAEARYALACVDFVRCTGRAIRLGGAHLPDVFDPGWAAACDAVAERFCTPWHGERGLLGYFTDEALGWAQFPVGLEPGLAAGENAPRRPTLLQLCLSLEPSFAAYHAAWEFVLAPRGGQWDVLSADWGLALSNKEALRQLTLEEVPLTSAGYRRDHERFSREFAHRYVRATAGSLARHDPHHLVLGCRFAEPPGAAVVEAFAPPAVHVLSCNAPRRSLAREISWYHERGDMPVLVGAFAWTGDAFTQGPTLPGEPPHLSELERMHRRGRAALEAACAHPALVGFAWSRWANDDPADAPPFATGLVRLDGEPAHENVQPLAALNAAAGSFHAAGRAAPAAVVTG